MFAPLSVKGYVNAVTNTRGWEVSIETHIASGYQYVTFIQDLTGSQRQMVIARRRRYPTIGAWERVACWPQGGNFFDAHNTCNLHVVQNGSESGKLSMSWDMHDVPFNYLQLRTPGDMFLNAITPLPIAPGGLSIESLVTYVIEREYSDGERCMVFRSGVSGSGNIILYHYSSGAWAIRQNPWFDGITDSLSIYWDRFQVKNDIFHMSGNVRTVDSNYTTNQDLYDLGYSTDKGVTIRRHDTGAAMTLPLRRSTTPLIYSIPQNTGLWNTAAMCIDDNDRPYIFRAYGPNPSQYYCHYLQGSLGSGTWKRSQAGVETTGGSFVGVSSPVPPFWFSPPQACYRNGQVGMLHWSLDRGNTGLWLKYASVASLQAETASWTTVQLHSRNWQNMDTHPNYDESLWNTYGQMDILYCDTNGDVSVETLTMPF